MTKPQTTIEQRNARVAEIVSELMPFSMASGDARQRLNPNARQHVNSTECWLVSNGSRSAHKLRKLQGELELLLTEWVTS